MIRRTKVRTHEARHGVLAQQCACSSDVDKIFPFTEYRVIEEINRILDFPALHCTHFDIPNHILDLRPLIVIGLLWDPGDLAEACTHSSVIPFL